ncbi:hypothetical protein AB0I72_20495 [Nocardiopsis sp. NPDC049922]|uniref:hypothetical protein n=1 Tax=Nocardiopsis sp. NPDC049922 TaxID=3155157 RepID=UPI0033CE9437
MSIPDTSPVEDVPEQEPPLAGARPNWWVSLAVVLVCLAVIATGWVVTKLAVGDGSRPRDLADGTGPMTVASAPSVEGVDPEDAGTFIGVSTELVESASMFRITFSVYEIETSGRSGGEGTTESDAARSTGSSGGSTTGADGTASAGEEGTGAQEPDGAGAATSGDGGTPEADDAGSPDSDSVLDSDVVESTLGEGQVVYDTGKNPKFEHVFRTPDGARVDRYQMSAGQLVMTADVGVPGLVVLDPPDEADRYLCSNAFATAHLREVLSTSTDLTFVGRERVELSGAEETVAHSTYLYTGTFTSLRGGYDTTTGDNTLTSVAGTEFRLWIDELGYPRRLVLRSRDGIGETHEFHSFG